MRLSQLLSEIKEEQDLHGLDLDLPITIWSRSGGDSGGNQVSRVEFHPQGLILHVSFPPGAEEISDV